MSLDDEKKLSLMQQLELQAENLTLEFFNKFFPAYVQSGSDVAVKACYTTIQSLMAAGDLIPQERLREIVEIAHADSGVDAPDSPSAVLGCQAELQRLVGRCIEWQLNRLADKTQTAIPFARFPRAGVPTSETRGTSTENKGPTIGEAIAQYRKIRTEGLEQETVLKPAALRQFDAATRLFLYHFGKHKRLCVIAAEQLSKFIQLWCELPRGYPKYLDFAEATAAGKLSLEALVEQREDDDDVLSRATVKKDAGYIKTMYNFIAKKRPWLEGCGPLVHALEVDARDSEHRDVVGAVQLARLFGPEYVGLCRGRAERYWLPLLMLHAGMRPNEIAQLYCDDVELDPASGRYWLYCCQEKNRRQSLKTKQSFRAIPVHPWLVRNGFIRYRDSVAAAGHSQLFPRLWQGKASQIAEPVTSWFGPNVLRPVEPSPSVVLYSLRHTFAGGLRSANAGEFDIGRLLGHSSGKAITERYGRGLKPNKIPELISVVDRLDWSESLAALPEWSPQQLTFTD